MTTLVCSHAFNDSLFLEFFEMIFHSIFCNIIYIRCNSFTIGVWMFFYIFNNRYLYLR